MTKFYQNLILVLLSLTLTKGVLLDRITTPFVLIPPKDEMNEYEELNGKLEDQLNSTLITESLRGLQVKITYAEKAVADVNLGAYNQNNASVKSNVMFRVASLSKAVTVAGLMKLWDAGKFKLTDSLSSLLGFKVENPNYPGMEITAEMLLSHTSSILECDPYYSNFLTDTYNSATGNVVPFLSSILTPSGKYWNTCTWNKKPPGKIFSYANLNFVIAGTIIEKLSGIRFDIFMQNNILNYLKDDFSHVPSFNPANSVSINDLGVIYIGKNGQWIPNADYYPNGSIPSRNLDGYEIGTNGGIYGPQGGLRASATHLNNFVIMLNGFGITREGIRIISKEAIIQMITNRYMYSGTCCGPFVDYHLYSLGLYATTYRVSDSVISHEVVRGHTGAAYGLVSGYYFWGKWTFAYIVNGALNGYIWGAGTIYERVRNKINQAVDEFVKNYPEAHDELFLEKKIVKE